MPGITYRRQEGGVLGAGADGVTARPENGERCSSSSPSLLPAQPGSRCALASVRVVQQAPEERDRARCWELHSSEPLLKRALVQTAIQKLQRTLLPENLRKRKKERRNGGKKMGKKRGKKGTKEKEGKVKKSEGRRMSPERYISSSLGG